MALDEQLFPKQGAQPKPVADQTGVLATRVKLAEGRYVNLQKRNRLTEEALLAFEKDARTQLRVLTQQVVELRRKVGDINQKMDAMVGELNSVVQKQELVVVERYLDLWQPMQFVTREEARRMIRDMRDVQVVKNA